MHRSLEIRVDGIRVFARHGVLAEEAALGQRFAIDLALVPLSDAACDVDDVAEAVDYGAVVERVVALATTERFALIERLADAIARDLLDAFPLAVAEVRVRKPSAPVAAIVDDVSVVVRLARA